MEKQERTIEQIILDACCDYAARGDDEVAAEAKASLLEWFSGQIPEKKLSARLIADDPRYDQFEKGYNEAIETLTRNIEGASK